VASPRHRWLLPGALRSGVVLIDSACVGLAGLAWAAHNANNELLTVLASIVGGATLLAVLPRRGRPPTARTVAAVLAATPLPAGRILGRCAMSLRLNDVDGSPRQLLHIEPHTPTAMWPTAGSRVVVEVTRARTPRVAVLWQLGITYPEPAFDERGLPVPTGLDEADLQALPPLERVALIALWQPSHLARRYLVPTERYRGEWRRHWIRWLKEFAVGLGLSVLLISGYHTQVGKVTVDLREIQNPYLVAQVFWCVWVIWRGLTWLNNRLVLTSRRVMLIKGLFWRRVASVPLAKAADVLHTKSPLAWILGYGAFRFNNISMFRPMWRVGDLPNTRDLYLQIVGETFDPEPPQARPELEEVDASLDDLVAIQFIG
jgi:hypothetical protein